MPTTTTNPFLLLLITLTLFIGGCSNSQAADTYSKDGISFQLPKQWSVSNDSQLFDERSIAINTTATSVVLIEGFAKDLLEREPEHKQLSSSLKRYANNFKKRDITTKLQTSQPITEETVQRLGHNGLKETQKFIIADKVNELSIREYYRLDTKDEVIFITMDTNKDEYPQAASGFDVILKSFKYTSAK